jgi:hypothetical protein
VDLAEWLDQVLVELETSADPERLALLRRLQAGTHTPQDASDVADMIEVLVARAVKERRN